MDLSEQDIQRFGEATGRFERIVEQLGRMQRTAPASQATITVNAGGLGLWIAVTCCAVMLAVGVVGCVAVSSAVQGQNRRIEKQDEALSRMQDYLNAIYVQAPSLRPKEAP